LQEANLEHLGQYWQNRFKNKPPLLELPYDKERPRVQTYNGEDVSFNISYPLTTKLRNMASQHQATLFMVLLASINALLFHYTGQTDITIGTPAAGRDHIDIENQIGLYLNTLALRTIFAEKNSFTQLLHLVKNVTLEAYAHQLLPFDRLVDQLKIKREASRHPLFDVMVDMLNLLHLNESLNHPPDQGEPGETRENETPAQLHKSRTKTDLIIYFHESAASILVTFEYNTDLFERQTIIRMISRYKKLLAAVFENPAQPMADLQVQEEVKIPAFAPFGLQESK
jgi:non-ribosomal peptide synthetase component F